MQAKRVFEEGPRTIHSSRNLATIRQEKDAHAARVLHNHGGAVFQLAGR